MQGTQKPPARRRRFDISPRVLCILGFVCTYLVGLALFAPSASAAALSSPGGNVSDPVVRQVDIARPAVVRIITTITGQLTVRFTTTISATFPVTGGSYPIEMSGTGAFISAHGDILTADHVVNPPRGQDLDNALYTEAAQDVADYINTHFQVSAPYSPSDAYSALSSGLLPSSTSYGQPNSVVYLSTSYAGQINATKLETVPAADHATVDKIEAQSAVNASDVAIVHVSGMDNMPSIQLGDSSRVAEQDNLTIIGYPGLGDVSQSPTNLLTSSINKVYVSALKETDSGSPVIQVGGNVENGDSGGPALDDSGNIVGIVSFGLSGTNGDIGETSFLQASSGAETLIKSLGLNTAPGTFQKAWAQAIDDYASSDSDHWQKASQDLQALAHAYPQFQGGTPYLNYAQSQANGQGSSLGGGPGGVVWIILLIVVLLAVLGIALYLILRRNARSAVVVAPGGAQYPAGAYGPYAQQSGVYPPTAAYGASGVYPQVAPGAQPVPGVQQGIPSGVIYPNYTSPAAYAPAANGVPQTPALFLSATPLPQPVAVEEPRHPAFSQPPVQTPWPSESADAQPATSEQVAPAAQPGSEASTQPAQEPVASSASQSGTLSEVMGKSATYTLPADQAETLRARTLAVPPGETQLPSGDSWPTFADSKETASDADSGDIQDRPTDRMPAEPSRSPSERVEPEQPEARANTSYIIAPCGHPNPPGVRFCLVCGKPIMASAATNNE